MSDMPAQRPTRTVANMPPDGRRYEVVDGALIVTPSPGLRHQDVVFRLATLLDAASAGTRWHVVVGPFDVALSEDTVLIPDIVVAPRGDFTEHDVQATSALIVEVRTAQTAYMDARTKRDLYAASGVPFYWQVDPVEPSITALKLVDHRYAEDGRAAGTEHLDVKEPFPVRVAPKDLLS